MHHQLLETTDGAKLLSSDVVDLDRASSKKASMNGVFGCLSAEWVSELSKGLQ